MFRFYYCKACPDFRKFQNKLYFKLGIAVIACIILCSTCYLAECRGKSSTSADTNDRKTEKLIQINHRSDNHVQKTDNADSPISFLRCARTDALDEGSGNYIDRLEVPTHLADRHQDTNYVKDMFDSTFREKHKRFQASTSHQILETLFSNTRSSEGADKSLGKSDLFTKDTLQNYQQAKSRVAQKRISSDQDHAVDADILTDPFLESSEERYFPHEFLLNSDKSGSSEEDVDDFFVTDEDRGDFIQLAEDPYNTQRAMDVPNVVNSLFSNMPNAGAWSFSKQNLLNGDSFKSDASNIQPRWKLSDSEKLHRKEQGGAHGENAPLQSWGGLDLRQWFLKSEKDISNNLRNSVRVFSEMFGPNS